MERDQEIFDLIEQEHQRQLRGMELIASENFVSDEVMQAMGSYLTNKYAEGLPGKRYYGGCQVVDQVETLAIERVKKLFGAEFANVQPHSGAQANQAVLLAVLKPGDTFMGLDLDQGGHLSHGSSVNTSGILYNHIGYTLNRETGRVDYDNMEKLALEYKPKLIIGGGSAYSREWDYERMRKIADEVGALLMIDMAHPAGLIAAGLLKNLKGVFHAFADQKVYEGIAGIFFHIGAQVIRIYMEPLADRAQAQGFVPILGCDDFHRLLAQRTNPFPCGTDGGI